MLKHDGDPVLLRFLVELRKIYGARLERVVLFGSRARQDAREDSDYDLAVFLKDSGGLWAESEHIAKIEDTILGDMGAVINAIVFPTHAYFESSPLMHEVRHDGRDL